MYGTGNVASLLRETDSDVLLAVQAVNQAAQTITEQHLQRQAKYIIHELSKAWK